MVTRFGFLAPRGTPDAALDRLSALILRGGADPAYAAAMNSNYNDVELLDRARFQQFLAVEDRQTATLLDALNIQ